MFATISDPFVEHNAKISIWDKNDPSAPILEIDIPKEPSTNKRVNATNIWWTALNEHLLVAFENGTIRLYNPVTGSLVDTMVLHEKKINRLQMNLDKTLFLTSSADFTSKLYDAVNFTHLKTYKTDRPVNDAVISEHKDHILLGGGQEAMSVTTTAGKVGKFETRFFHLVYEEEFGCVKGHFGPINAREYANPYTKNKNTCVSCVETVGLTIYAILHTFLLFVCLFLSLFYVDTVAINPNGRNYASGAEDGYVRLHFFDKSYLDMKDPVPEADEEDEEEDENPAQ